MSNSVSKILDWYRSENPGVRAKLYRLLTHGRLAGTGKLVILPVDQGFEHGPARSFAPNPAGYDPRYHIRLAIEAGMSAYAAPLGFIEAVAHEFAGRIPLILKLNNHDSLMAEDNPIGAQTASVQDALRLGCDAIGYTIYPGTEFRVDMYEQFREIALEAKEAGLLVVLWSYPRGGDLTKEDETALDVVAYAAQIAAQLGAHIIKVKVPSDRIAQEAARKVYDIYNIRRETIAERVRHVVQSAFDGRRIVIFSGGAKKDDDDALLKVIEGIRDGGGFGSIIGRNTFQRQRDEAVKMLDRIMEIYGGK
ncbi:MAG TPA: class I fructose-bisphosphate aldolase [candidate division Zixibacteria bacterium]|nr:class I fructose-bisphosphate aldolase [candidate division Zixibacteria bacterium]